MARRPVRTLPLPGDDDAVLAYRTAKAIRRDGRLNWQERAASILGLRCAKLRWIAEERGMWWPCSPWNACESCRTVKELPDGNWKLE